MWYHEAFIRGSPEKLSGIIRTKIKGTGHTNKIHKQAPNSSLMISPYSVISEYLDTEEEFVQSPNGSCASADTLKAGNATCPEVSFSDYVFDKKVKELFSIEEVPRRVSVSNVDHSVMSSDPLLTSSKEDHVMSIDIDPLPIDDNNATDKDDFQKFLNLLIQ